MSSSEQFVPFLQFDLPYAKTWGKTGAGAGDRDRVRQAAVAHGFRVASPGGKYRVEISLTKAGRRPFDIENAIKPIVDAFSWRQIRVDESEFEVGLYEDDTIDHVVEIVVRGRRGNQDSTRVVISRED